MSFGLTSTGFSVKQVSDILSEIEQAELSEISPSLNVQPFEPVGVVNAIVAQALSELWQLAAALYNGMDPDQATEDQLESLALITGTTREPATATAVSGCTVNVNAGFSQAAQTMFASVVGSPDVLFQNVATVASVGGGNVTVDFEAVQAGPIPAPAGYLTVISVPVTGWNSITNPTDGVLGSPVETDPQLRVRRQAELAASGSDTAASIRSLIVRNLIPPTTTSKTEAATVLFNDSDATNGDGLPPHSIEAIVYQPGNTSGDDIVLAQLLLDNKAAGIQTYSGNSTFKTVKDSQGTSENIYYTRPVATRLYSYITILTDATFDVVGGPAAVKKALADYALATYQPGTDVYVLALKSQALLVRGVLDVTVFKVDTIAVPVNTANIAITIRQVASLQTADITVTVT